MKKIDETNIPTHIAIIMDGNGRWAKKRFLPRLAGHKAGVDALKRITKAGKELGVKVMSFYAFSTENWKRDKEEVDGIFDLVYKHLKENYDDFVTNKETQIRTMGDISKLPTKLYELLKDVTEKTKNNNKFVVNIGLNYGFKDEIVRACNNLVKLGKEVTSEDIEDNLYTCGLPNPDLVIRTSGEQRLSNFMLYQSAYSELYFPKTYWPDFDKKHLIKAIINYQSRDRRFGNIKQEKK